LYDRERYWKNRKRIIELIKAWQRRNPDKVREQKKQYSLKNKEKIRSWHREWAKKNRARLREIEDRWEKNHPNRRKEISLRWRRRHGILPWGSNRSKNEQILMDVLHSSGFNFTYQYRVPNTKYVADFLLSEKKLIIELDGFWHRFKREQAERDQKKDEAIKALNYRLLRVKIPDDLLHLWNQELTERFTRFCEGVVEKVFYGDEIGNQ
jgi:very-short-patch-repair endonuclease